MQIHSYCGFHLNTTDSIDIRSPADQRVTLGHMPVCTKDHLNQCLTAAKEAQSRWQFITIEQRIAATLKFASLVAQNADELVSTLKLEQAMIDSVVRREIDESIKQIKQTCQVALKELKSETLNDGTHNAVIEKVPYGIVGAIVPWNAPISLATAKLIPAVLAGNAVIVKPSPRAPLGVTFFLMLANQCFPPGLINIIHGLEELGHAIVTSPGIRKLTFTGSTSVGRLVAEDAAKTLKSVQLELGGNDAAILLPDTDIKNQARKIIDSAFRRSGQFCYATKRVYVHESIHDELIDQLCILVDELKIGSPKDPETTLGPVIDKLAQGRLNSLIQSAKDSGAVVRSGGVTLPTADLQNGCYVLPTLIWDVDSSHSIVAEEQFGPILPIVKYTDIEQVIDEINSQEYGLSGSVWGADSTTCSMYASRLEVSRVFINAAKPNGAFAGELPAGGHKQSGVGWEKSIYGLREYYQYRTINRSND